MRDIRRPTVGSMTTIAEKRNTAAATKTKREERKTTVD